jgi:hypothetical protein
MEGSGATGELLINLSDPSLPPIPGPVWAGAGNPALVAVAIPSDALLIGLEYFAQGMLFDAASGASVRFGATEGLRVRIAP